MGGTPKGETLLRDRQRARQRAYRRLADLHDQEFERLFNQEVNKALRERAMALAQEGDTNDV